MSSGADLVAQAQRVLGAPYQYGAQGPTTFDCSGLVYWCCHNIGVTSCPRTSEQQWAWVNRVSAPSTGDLVFFIGAEPDPSPGHVGIVVAPGQMIEAPHTGSVVMQTSYATNGTGVNALVGYGSIPGLAASSSANASSVSAAQVQQQKAAAAVGSGMGVVMFLALLLVVITLAVLAGAGMLFTVG